MTTKYKSVFISDIHLGSNGCRANDLCNFLKSIECENLYLVGDIIDGWKLKRNWYWPQEHSNIIRKLLTKAKRGTKITYITGNHDEFLREWIGNELNIGDITIVNQCTYTSISGEKYLIIHGDIFDAVTTNYKWVSLLGDIAYESLLRANIYLNAIRQKCGFGFWSLSKYIKNQAKQAVNFIFSFENHLSHHAKINGYDGAIVGHIHHSEIKIIDGIKYMNCGDWVESCTALVETYDGEFQILELGMNGEMHVAKTSLS